MWHFRTGCYIVSVLHTPIFIPLPLKQQFESLSKVVGKPLLLTPPVRSASCIASIDLKATPMVSTNQLANAVENLEDEEEEEETGSELSTQLREAKEKISALEDKLKAQERLLKEAEENRSFGSESVGAKHSRSSGQVNNELESQNIAVKRPAAAEEEAIVKKVRGSDEKFGQEKGINSDQTIHPEATSTSAQPSGSRSSTIESVSSSSATPAPLNITKPSKDLLENTAPSKSTATGVEPDPCSLYFLARTTFVLVILARGQKSL